MFLSLILWFVRSYWPALQTNQPHHHRIYLYIPTIYIHILNDLTSVSFAKHFDHREDATRTGKNIATVTGAVALLWHWSG